MRAIATPALERDGRDEHGDPRSNGKEADHEEAEQRVAHLGDAESVFLLCRGLRQGVHLLALVRMREMNLLRLVSAAVANFDPAQTESPIGGLDVDADRIFGAFALDPVKGARRSLWRVEIPCGAFFGCNMRKLLNINFKGAHVRYKTKQQDAILAVLSREGHVTADGIVDALKAMGTPVSTATAYRALTRFEEEGLVRRMPSSGRHPSCFEYLGRRGDAAAPSAVHCECRECGQIIHLQCHELDSLREHIAAEHGFEIDPWQTVLFGTCDSCRSKQGANSGQTLATK